MTDFVRSSITESPLLLLVNLLLIQPASVFADDTISSKVEKKRSPYLNVSADTTSNNCVRRLGTQPFVGQY